jgi:hypothetical protein
LTSAPAKKLLVAVRPKDTRLLLDVLGTEFDMAICHTYEDAMRRFDEPIGLIVCGVHFAGDRMFDLLSLAKCAPEMRSVPFFVVLGKNIGYSEVIVDSIRSATRLMGADGFVELSALESDVGQEQAYENLRQGIRDILSSDQSYALGMVPASDACRDG